jgi:1,4-dihydroxy-2-naphthoate octaprenyltransferase
MKSATRPLNNFQEMGFWKLLHNLSLDVVLGALLCGYMAVSLLEVRPGWAYWIVLASAVWIIYTTDHLIDGLRLKYSAHTIRHIYHFHHRKIITIVISVLVIVNLLLVLFFLDQAIILFGAVLGAIAICYLLLVFWVGGKRTVVLQKEIFVALIYSAGIWGPAIALADYRINIWQTGLVATFFLLVLADILLFSLFEVENDEKDKHFTLAIRLGPSSAKKLIDGLTLVIASASFVIFFGKDDPKTEWLSVIYLTMAGCLVFMIRFRDWFKVNSWYRYLGEAVFWMPGLLIFVR